MGAARIGHKRGVQHRVPSEIVENACRTVLILFFLGGVGVLLLTFRRLPAEKPAAALNFSYGRRAMTEKPAEGDLPLLRPSPSQDYFLAAVIFNRVFDADLFNITGYECKQWIEYMLYAGVEHVFWYDTAHQESESQEDVLKEYVNNGVLTYHRFHELFPGNVRAGYHFEQDHSYVHFLQNHGSRVKWVVEMDVDEYPFVPSDLGRSFLKTFLKSLERKQVEVTQLLLSCMIFGGNPRGDLENGWVIERYQRRKRFAEGGTSGTPARTKPIFQPQWAKGVAYFDPHQFPMKAGRTETAQPEVIRMNHYWGPRLSDFGPDTPAVLEMLIPDTSLQSVASQIKESSRLTLKESAMRSMI